MVKNATSEEGLPRIYEAGYLITPTIPEEAVGGEVVKLRELIGKFGGSVVTEEDPKLRELAYEMEKVISHKKEIFRNAYFGWIKFEMDADDVTAFQKALDGNASIIRYLLISTVREHTIASKRPMSRGPEGRRTKDGTKLSDEEIEKTIQELVA